MIIKILYLFIFFLSITEISSSFLKQNDRNTTINLSKQIKETWEDILDYIRSVPRDNVTLIGWRKVLDNNGNVNELQAIQLEIPTESTTEAVKKIKRLKYKFDRFEPLQQYEASIASFEIYKSANMPIEYITQEQRDLEGEFENVLYLDSEGLIARDVYKVYIKKSVNASSKEQVDNFVKNLKLTNLEQPSILKYDSTGNLKSNESVIRFQLQGTLNAEEHATNDMIKHGPKILSRIALQHSQRDVPKKLVEHYSKKYPKYSWNVIINPQDYYLAKNISLNLNFGYYNHFYYFGNEDQSINYYLYGFEKIKTNIKK